MLTAEEVAAELKCKPSTVKAKARQGLLRGTKAVGMWRFDPKDVAAFRDAHANTGPTPETTRRRRRRAS